MGFKKGIRPSGLGTRKNEERKRVPHHGAALASNLK